MRLHQPVRALLATFALAAGLGALSATPAAAAPAAPSAACKFHLTKLIAHDTLKNNGTDFVWLKLNQTFYPPGNKGLSFQQGDERDGEDFGIPDDGVGFPASGLPARLVFDTFPFNRVLGPETIPCDPGSSGTVDFQATGVYYEMFYTVTN
jgi:hypothetical protein